jgi:hypothetical protein
MHCELLCNQLYQTPEILKDVMLKIVPIDGIGLSCVALEMSRTFLMHRITALCVFILQTT